MDGVTGNILVPDASRSPGTELFVVGDFRDVHGFSRFEQSSLSSHFRFPKSPTVTAVGVPHRNGIGSFRTLPGSTNLLTSPPLQSFSKNSCLSGSLTYFSSST